MIENVLCMCYGNACRSPMMAAILNSWLGNAGFPLRPKKVNVESAGMNPRSVGQCATYKSVVCMSRIGIDISGHRARCINDIDLGRFDLFVCAEAKMADALRAKGVTGTVIVLNKDNGGISNPYPSPEQSRYDRCCAEILAATYEDVIAKHFQN